jgi:MYXO-CTERM domain-containing protein
MRETAMKKLAHALAVLLALASMPSLAAAQATLVNGLGGPLDFGTGMLARGDDSISSEVDLTPLFPTGFDFYGHHYTSLFVNTNGNVSFGGSLSTFTPDPFPLATGSRPMIAAWWGDVDTRAIPADEKQNLVYWAVDTVNMRFVATWSEVGYYMNHIDLLNSFQIVLTPAADGSATFDVELRYNRCEWTTGDASMGHAGLGGIPAQAGFDAANGVDFLTLPGSRSMAVLDLCTQTNAGMPGVWRLHGAATARCGDRLLQTGEQCDDGNVMPGDGCDARCQIEVRCALPDADQADGNGMDAALPLCTFDAGPPDTGPTVFDTGTRFDAGPRVDAARPMDAGTPSIDVTGSGCGCRVGHGDARGAAAMTMLLLAALARRRRPRAR